MDDSFDVVVVGGGIIGLATTLAILDLKPDARVCVLEKEPRVGRHQTGHNSGVIHSGIYYRPGSLKARLCREGSKRLLEFCAVHGVPVERRGKLVVATNAREVEQLDELERRGRANGVPGIERLPGAAIAEIEPHAAGVAALRVPGTSVVDFREVAGAMAGELRHRGADIMLGAEVLAGWAIDSLWRLRTRRGVVVARLVVNCAGLQSDRVAGRLGAAPPVRILPFRGEYWNLSLEASGLVRGLIYPVPDPRFPFLGVHLTRDVHDHVHAGPNAVLALAREGYERRRASPRDALETLAYPGFARLARRYWRTGLEEMARSRSRRGFAAAARRLVPELSAQDLVSREAGVRAQAVTPEGRLLDDFSTLWGRGALHVLNAPSPAATASLAIGEWIAGGLERAGALAV